MSAIDFSTVLRPLMLICAAVSAVVLIQRPCSSSAAPEANDGPRVELPYADPSGGRKGYRFSDEPVNAARLYDFYARQADYYMDGDVEVPDLLPAFPGLDAGAFGHWGKFSQNDHIENRWNWMEVGSVVAGMLSGFGKTIPKGVAVRLGEAEDMAAAFDPETGVYPAVWKGSFVQFGDRRFGLVENVNLPGEPMLLCSADAGVDRYHGYFRAGERAVFHYSLQGVEILDAPWSIWSRVGKVFTRSIQFPDGGDNIAIPLFDRRPELDEVTRSTLDGEHPAIQLVKKDFAQAAAVRGGDGVDGLALDVGDDGVVRLTVERAAPAAALKIYQMGGNSASLPFFEFKVTGDSEPEDLAKLTAPEAAEPLWDWTWTEAGELDLADWPYVVDSIPVPLENPYRSMMFLSGHDFFANGDAAVCTIMGDVWTVRGLDASLGSVTWRRFAAGLNQPLGLCIVDDDVYVLGKDQITRLRDRNGDGEADAYDSFCNAYITSPGAHDYATGLQRDAEGNFYFATSHAGVYRVTPDGRTAAVIATGFRNPNGVGVSPDGVVTVGGQEGEWTPASSVIRVEPGAFYGYRAKEGDTIAPPLAFVPRGLDNSTAGQAFAPDDDRFGPLGGQLLSLSFGAGTWYAILQDEVDGVHQGAVVPLDGDFLAAPMRARFRPQDGQLYVTCSEGWGDYAAADGSFHRLRYTGRPLLKPIGFHAHYNGLVIEFAERLEKSSAEDPAHYFAQQWNYQYTEGYGSPEYSVLRPDDIGHDRVEVKSATLLPDGRSVFLEMPGLIPVMQLHVRMHLAASLSGGRQVPFRTELFPTLHKLDDPFEEIPAYAAAPEGKPTELAMRIAWRNERAAAPEPAEPGRPITVQAITGLRYDTTEIAAAAGERLSLTLQNVDVIPHNLVIARPESLKEVGELANRMLGHPDAAATDYVPDSALVLHFIRVLQPGESDTLHFDAPSDPGIYPFLCTFPGHWMLMNGTLRVTPTD